MCCFGKPKPKESEGTRSRFKTTRTTTNAVTAIPQAHPVTALPQTIAPKNKGLNTGDVHEKTADDPGSSKRTDVDKANLPPEVISAMISFADETIKKGVDGLKKEFEKISAPKILPSLEFKKNELKNRYSNIPCFDKTRIVLKYKSPPESDYIHANRVSSSIGELKSQFICTQAPTDRTTNDFWRMVWQEKPKFIVMLCKVLENNKPKCAEYWPKTNGETKNYNGIVVTNEGDGGKGGELVFDIEQFRVCADGSEIRVKHIRWLDWPDFGIPKSGLGMLRILRKIDQDKGTAIVHCSAGIGRTGTLLAAEITMKALTTGKRIKMPDIVNELREHRYGLIQTSSQYVYLHYSICTYCERKLKGIAAAGDVMARLKQFFAAYRDYATNEEMLDKILAQKQAKLRNETKPDR